jgi:phospholipase D1/2
MFHPSSNRLAGFLEVSALSISLAQSGGVQYKAGLLQTEPSNNGGGGFGRKSAGWKAKKEARWCAVRESYLVAMEEPGEVGRLICLLDRRIYAYHLPAQYLGCFPDRFRL